MAVKNDFSQGSIMKSVLSMAVPTVVAQCVQLLYNMVDRIYLGRLPGVGSLALTGVGLTFPIIMLITAFTNLYGQGGAPLCSIRRGAGDLDTARRIMNNCLVLEVLTGAALMAIFYGFMRPILFAFGASASTWPYAQAYLQIYLLGTVLNMVSLGMNSFVNAQGFGRVGMMTTVIGGVLNLVLDPVFIFVLGMGVRGAALATVISQCVSCVWVLCFLASPNAIFGLDRQDLLAMDWPLMKQVVTLGFASFLMAVTNSVTQVVCNAVLSVVGGDLYVGVMTVVNSVREGTQLPTTGFTHGSQPVIGYNYGAKKYSRTRRCIWEVTWATLAISVTTWLLIVLFPRQLMCIFTSDPGLIEAGIPALKLFFFGYFFMTFQFVGQCTFVSLGRSRYAIFFSTLRKLIIVTPLTLWLPHVAGLGVMGVFLAEPISNLIGGLACYGTMLATVWRDLKKLETTESNTKTA